MEDHRTPLRVGRKPDLLLREGAPEIHVARTAHGVPGRNPHHRPEVVAEVEIGNDLHDVRLAEAPPREEFAGRGGLRSGDVTELDHLVVRRVAHRENRRLLSFRRAHRLLVWRRVVSRPESGCSSGEHEPHSGAERHRSRARIGVTSWRVSFAVSVFIGNPITLRVFVIALRSSSTISE